MSRACDCIHYQRAHDPSSGACLIINPFLGPCPCRATPAATERALRASFYYTRSQGRSYDREPITPANTETQP